MTIVVKSVNLGDKILLDDGKTIIQFNRYRKTTAGGNRLTKTVLVIVREDEPIGKITVLDRESDEGEDDGIGNT